MFVGLPANTNAVPFSESGSGWAMGQALVGTALRLRDGAEGSAVDEKDGVADADTAGHAPPKQLDE
jgi:hypothetical protein